MASANNRNNDGAVQLPTPPFIPPPSRAATSSAPAAPPPVRDTSEKSPLVVAMMASSISGMISRIPMHPVDTIKARMQVRTSRGRQGFVSAFQNVVRTDGVRGLYRGFGITFLGSSPGSCAYFTSYEASKKVLNSLPFLRDHQFLANFCAGLSAETISCVVWVPIDVVKERLQVQSSVPSAGATRYRGSWHALRTIMQTEGLRGIYKGYGATVASFGPFSAVYLSSYEQLKLAAAALTGRESVSELSPEHFVACGGTAGALASFLTNPLDMSKLRIQVSRSQAATNTPGALTFEYRNIFHGVVQIARQEGFFGLWKGAGARMLFHAPSTAITIGIYDTLRQAIQRVYSAPPAASADHDFE